MGFKILDVKNFLSPRYYRGNDKPAAKDLMKKTCLQVEWDIRPFYVPEVMTNDPDYIYSKRVIYIEKENKSYCLVWGDNHDQKGRLWRSDAQFSNYEPSTGIHGARSHSYRNLLTKHATFLVFKVILDGSEIPLEKFSIKHLLKGAR